MPVPLSSSESTVTSICSEQQTTNVRGRTWVLLRGLLRSRFHWHKFPHLLAQQPWVDRILQPELAGNGERSHDITPNGITAMMEDLRAQVLPQLAQDQKVHLLAISMGAMIATEWARLYPHEIAEMHLINTSFGRYSSPWERMRPLALYELLKVAITTRLNPAALEAAILAATVNQRIPADVLGEWIRFAWQHPQGWRNTLTQIWSASRYQGLEQAPIKRTFIYTCQHDRLVSSRASERIADHWRKPLHCHTTAGHDLPLEDPAWLLERIAQSTANSDTRIV
ncbi:alpha/beta fold hydrolase [Parathalassolituus penaei]|uniref:Alpha/beta hydrolase n=1 Tax=Parathalassolituus penaei TaxID=2997323 RepID=A0A9X3EGE3_9GAMM|nr:alpha/beta hydrolase [Parathalassolituus penaei]MCY0966746.1 alpha/beta hydrolase [Parathalassolituus penaei]